MSVRECKLVPCSMERATSSRGIGDASSLGALQASADCRTLSSNAICFVAQIPLSRGRNASHHMTHWSTPTDPRISDGMNRSRSGGPVMADKSTHSATRSTVNATHALRTVNLECGHTSRVPARVLTGRTPLPSPPFPAASLAFPSNPSNLAQETKIKCSAETVVAHAVSVKRGGGSHVFDFALQY
eukprot:2677333-Rhodomonas_salina.3